VSAGVPARRRIAASMSASRGSLLLKLNIRGMPGIAVSTSSTVGIMPTPRPRSGKVLPPSAV
jgi:hypothetical protein